ncbi:hypothetical protein ACFL47_11280 [Candidatus Latescibacterota bacterium]
MKKLGLLTMVLAVAALVLVPVWVTADEDETTAPVTTGINFLDEDGDGFCDNYDGTGQGRRLGRGQGTNFVDEDGDGVCDNNATGLGKGQGRGAGNGRLFVDADGDGVCDNCTEGATKNRSGRGRRGRGRAGK